MASFNLRTHDAAGSWVAEFTAESAETSLTFFLEADEEDEEYPTIEDVRAKVKQILGYTDTAVGANAKVQRVLPMAHPLYPNLTAYRVRVQPVPGEPEFSVEAADPEEILEAAVIHPDAVAWDSWMFEVSFSPRPFQMVTTAAMPTITDSVYEADGSGPVNYTHHNEHLRFCEYTFTPRAEFVYARGGQAQMKFRRHGGADPDNTPFPDFPRILLPDEILTILWRQIPQRFLTSANSHLRRWRNLVNQHPFSLGGAEFEPGQLLYKGYKERAYSFPFPEIDDDWGGAGVFAASKVVDCEVEIWVTNRPATGTVTVENENWIPAHWNAQPNMRHGTTSGGTAGAFFYISADNADATKQYPMFSSFAMHLLFTDPDAP